MTTCPECADVRRAYEHASVSRDLWVARARSLERRLLYTECAAFGIACMVPFAVAFLTWGTR